MQAIEIILYIEDKEKELRGALEFKKTHIIAKLTGEAPTHISAFKSRREKWSYSRILRNAEKLGL